jgi:hypothetical protein
VDPFGGSGTTALTCQFLGVRPATIEVNPFLADLIEAKLSQYDLSSLIGDYANVIRSAILLDADARDALKGAPATFVEPGVARREPGNRPRASSPNIHWLRNNVARHAVPADGQLPTCA